MWKNIERKFKIKISKFKFVDSPLRRDDFNYW